MLQDTVKPRVKRFPADYLDKVVEARSLQERYQDNQGFTVECLPGETGAYGGIEFWVTLPPLFLDNRFVKGVFFSHGVDAILAQAPGLSRYFHSIADSLWCSYPWSSEADGLFTLYDNPAYLKWFCKTYPELTFKKFIPRQQADYTNEMLFSPKPGVARDIDVFCLSTFYREGNLPLIAEALKVYRQKYPENPIKLHLNTRHEFDLNFSTLNELELETLRQMQAILIHPNEYIHFVSGPIGYENDLPHYLSRSKVFLNPKLVGDKNQRTHEAMCCNTPIVCFKEFNSTVRGNTTPLAEGSGIACDFSAEALADALYQTLQHPEAFQPRQAYLQSGGRQHFFNDCVRAFSEYYSEAVPDFPTENPHQSYWLNSALQENYGMSLYEFYTLKDLWHHPFRVQGIDNIKALQQYYDEKFPL